MYEVRFAVGVADDLRPVRAGHRRRIIESVQRKLMHEPTRPTKHIKRLERLLLPFEHVPPIWQLRIGDYRVFYDVSNTDRLVIVRAVRRKPAHMTTEQIL